MRRTLQLTIVLVIVAMIGVGFTTTGLAQTDGGQQSTVDMAALNAFADALAALQEAPLTPAQMTALVELYEQAAFSVDDEYGPVVTYMFDQATANEIVDELIGLAGYTPQQASVDLQPGGVLATVTDAYEGETLQFWLTGGLDEGAILDLNVEWMMLDGERFEIYSIAPAEFIMEVVVTNVVMDVFDELLSEFTGFTYAPVRVYVTENDIVVEAAMLLEPTTS